MSRRRRNFGVLLGLVVAVWFGWGAIRALLLGGRVSYVNSPVGMWVGEMEITGYNKKVWGDTPGSHRHAALYANLDVEDHFMDEYNGDGQLFIAGEQKSRPLHMNVDIVHKENNLPNTDCSVNSNPGTENLGQILAETDHCHFFPDTIAMKGSDDEAYSKLRFKVVLHRGNLARYQDILSKLQADATHELNADLQSDHTDINQE